MIQQRCYYHLHYYKESPPLTVTCCLHSPHIHRIADCFACTFPAVAESAAAWNTAWEVAWALAGLVAAASCSSVALGIAA